MSSNKRFVFSAVNDLRADLRGGAAAGLSPRPRRTPPRAAGALLNQPVVDEQESYLCWMLVWFLSVSALMYNYVYMLREI